MTDYTKIPEIASLLNPRQLVRLPEQIDVPVTPRIMRLVDTPQFQRLKTVSQLGFVSLVYPGATHNRFEHSLGVYRMALLFIQQLSADQRFRSTVSIADAELLIVAALLHDIAHWPFCHPIEDLNLPGVRHHEHLAANFLSSPEVSTALFEDWGLDWQKVFDLLTKNTKTPGEKILSSILSGPIDVDKMDYLYRDSLHAGVPYGKHFDSARLIGSLCLNEAGTGIAITTKGKTAAELMVFARYVMFSEIYWHHAVRSATAMFQRAFFLLQDRLDESHLNSLFNCKENEIAGVMKVLDSEERATVLTQSLFGPSRRLFKRWAEFSFIENEELHSRIAQRPYKSISDLCDKVAGKIETVIGQSVEPNHVLIDAPPIGLEVQFDVEVYCRKSDSFNKLANLSPVVTALASKQFDNYVKKVRLFVHPDLFQHVGSLNGIELLQNCDC